MSQFYNDSIFWIDVEKIHPNPYQPRREFDEAQLRSLADSIRQYGVLQALVVTRKEIVKEDGGLVTEYELIAGERRLRASKLAGLAQVPALIKVNTDGKTEDDGLMKLELAIIENVQREDLNPVDRAYAFQRLTNEFGLTHDEVGKKVGKSRVYVSNTLRILGLPQDILMAVMEGKINEGHTRPLLMLGDRPEEQQTLFKEIMFKKLSVRDAESIARRIAREKARRKEYLLDPETQDLEEKLTETLGTRVTLEKREVGGRITIDFFSNDDVRNLLSLVSQKNAPNMNSEAQSNKDNAARVESENPQEVIEEKQEEKEEKSEEKLIDDRAPEEKKEEENMDDEMYSIKNFSI
jgi:ParB family chromosome partitioning protein